MALHTLGPVLYGSQENLLDYLKQKHLIPRSATCLSCTSMMDWKTRNNIKDGYTWRCTNPACRKMLTIRHGSFFEGSKLTLQMGLHIIYLWSIDTHNKTTVEAVGLSERVVIDAYSFLRDVCSWKLMQRPIVLGGSGRIVQIDESLFKHKPKVNYTEIYIQCI